MLHLYVEYLTVLLSHLSTRKKVGKGGWSSCALGSSDRLLFPGQRLAVWSKAHGIEAIVNIDC